MTAADLALLHGSGLFDAAWYLRRYPDVARGRLEPIRHFAHIGMALGRDPGPRFSTRYYLAANPDVAQAGIAAVLHYLQTGKAEGRRAHPPARPAPQDPALRRVRHLRTLLETGGLSATAGAALRATAQDQTHPQAAMLAREVLAFWALHRGDAASAAAAFATLGPRLAPMHLVAAARQAEPGANSLYDAQSVDPHLHLAATWLAPAPAEALTCLNRVLTLAGLAPFRLDDGDGPAFDRLHPETIPDPAPGSTDADAPLVSVLMAARNAEDVIQTALRSVTGQSWRALELLVIDDASTDTTAAIVAEAAARDPRIRLIPQAANRGAYVARNAGLAEARGRYITLHDADDWSHPERLARHVAFLERMPGHVGCLSTQVRCTGDLRVSRWTGTGALAFENLTSLMLPKTVFDSLLGGWDDVRVSADSELLRRVRCLLGETAVPCLPDGPLALQRDTQGTATADSATGMGWFYFGARREYYEAQRHHHATASSLRYDPAGAARPFPAPRIMTAQADRQARQRFDRVYAGILSAQDQSLETLLGFLDDDRAAGRRAALVPFYDIDQPADGGLSVHPLLRRRIDGQTLSVLCFGETADCAAFRLLPGQAAPAPARYLPDIWEGDRHVLFPTAATPED